MRTLARCPIAALALLAASVARAQAPWGSLEMGAGPYVPSIDREFGGAATPYQDIFGGSPAPMFRLAIAKAVFTGQGTVEVGFETGFFTKAGNAVQSTDTSVKTADRTSLNIIPTSLTVTYRAEQVYERLGVPLVPYARIALERYNWWVTKQSSWIEKGATNGWSASVGLALVLDPVDPSAARELRSEVGILHTDLYFDISKDWVNDFGSTKSWDLSNSRFAWSAGLLFVF